MHLQKDLREFVELLNSHRVEFVIVGAHALAFHGWPRTTSDIDILVRRSPENADRLEKVITEFGFASLKLTAQHFLEPDQVFQFGHPPNRIDVMTAISGVTFDEVWCDRVAGSLDGIPVSFIGREAFVRNKRASGRKKDLADVEALGEN
jgi:hypothetical protein